MYKYLKIVDIRGREVLDSRGNPTVEAQVTVKADGKAGELFTAIADVPSGASTGKFEAMELRDGDKRYNGAGVSQAVENINKEIYPALEGMNGLNQRKIDSTMIAIDGTENKKKLGANAILAVSMANMKACAKALKLPEYQYVGGICGEKMPIPMMNILNGGAHASNNIDVQEFMILPVGAQSVKEGIRWCAEVYTCLKKLLKKDNLSVAVGDEGGFAPNLSGEEEALNLIMAAIIDAGYRPGKDFMISLDVAASEWKGDRKGHYRMPKKNVEMDTDQLISLWEDIVTNYPIFSIEDPLDEEDWEGWKKITAANAILIKPNQIGSVMETIEAVRMAQSQGYIAIMSHRSGETEDTTIADLAVALNTGYIKTGAPCRGERTAKYNQLIRIEEMLTIK